MVQRLIRAFAGVFILSSVALGYWVSEYWFLVTVFVGVNLLQSSITRWCLLEDILNKIVKSDGKDVHKFETLKNTSK